MGRQQWNDGQEILDTDLSVATATTEKELYDRVFYQLMKRQQNVVFGDSFLASYVNATTSLVKAGQGFQYDNSQVDPEPLTRLLHVSADTQVTHTAAHATLNRYDIICIKHNRANTVSQNRNKKDAGTGTVSSVSMVIRTDWASDLLVVAGTAAGSPAVPATPAGYMKLTEVLITAATGIAGSGAYTDKRSRYGNPSSWRTTKTLTAAATLDLDDEQVYCNANGGAFAVTLPAASLCAGKTLKLYKTDSSANAITVTAAGADLIIGSATQQLTVQYESLILDCNGTGWYLS
jgi:hypothetical protein